MNDKQNVKNSRIWLGTILIFIGGLFLLNNYNILHITIPDFLLKWQYIFILMGLFFFFTMQNKTAGVIFIGIGGFNLYPEFWPVILVILGVFMLLRTSGKRDTSNIDTSGSINNLNSGKSGSFDYIDDVSIFGGGNKKIHSTNFKGGKITAIFGGAEINLEGCQLADGENVIDIVAMFGGSTLIVPNNWKVVLDIIPIFGGFSDKRRKEPNTEYEKNKILRIKGIVLFGGGEIK